MMLQKTWILLAGNKMMVTLVFLISCSGNIRNTEPEIIVLPPLQYEMYGQKDSVIKRIEKNNIQVDYDDSHSISDKGIQMYYFGTKLDSIGLYVELFFNEDILVAIKSKINGTDMTDDRFDNLISKEILPVFNEKELSKKFITSSETNIQKKETLLEVKSKVFEDLIK